MRQRDAVLVLGAMVLAVGIAAILLVGSLSPGTIAGDRQRFSQFGGPGRVPPARVSGQLPVRAPELGRVPAPFRDLVPVQRGIAEMSRDAAGYLLVLLLVSAMLVLGRDQVLATYRASLGGWRVQARIVGAGIATLALIASATFLTGVVFLGTLVGGPSARPFGQPPFLAPSAFSIVQLGLQVGAISLSVLFFGIALAGLVGFSAAAWRLGDVLVGLRVVARWGAQIPAPLVALLGASVLYLLAQLPYLGAVVFTGSLAYALGAVVTARLDQPGIRQTPAPTTR